MDAGVPTKWAILFQDQPFMKEYLWVKRLGKGAFARADLVRDMNGNLEVRKLLHQPAYADGRRDTIKAEIKTIIGIQQSMPTEEPLARLTSTGYTSGINEAGQNQGDRGVGYWRFYNLGSCLDVVQVTSRLEVYIPSSFAASLVVDCLSGLQALFQNGKMHNDLYHRNIFLNVKEEAGTTIINGVIGDFGLCRTLPNPPHIRRVCDMKNDLLTLNKCVKSLAENRRPAMEVELIKISMELIEKPLYPADSLEKYDDERRWVKIQSALDRFVSRWTNPSTITQHFFEGIQAFHEIMDNAFEEFDTSTESMTFNSVLHGIASETDDGVPIMFESFDELRSVAEQDFKGEIVQTVKICPLTFKICAVGDRIVVKANPEGQD